jgi:hypothetical protein
MEFVETSVFVRQADALFSPEELRDLQRFLVVRPTAGAVIPGSGGLRKLRWRHQGRGKRGGLRIIYYWISPAARLHLLFLYHKSVKSDLTPSEVRALRRLIEADET